MILDYAPPLKRQWHVSPRTIAAVAILAVWWIIYVAFCGPARHQRGYPPLEPHLQGLTLLWIVGIPLSALVQPFSKSRFWLLFAYAFASGLNDSASWPMMTPNFFNPSAIVLMTIFYYGPLHLIAALVIEAASRLSAGLAKWLFAKFFAHRYVAIAAQSLIAILLLAGTPFLPDAYTAFSAWSNARSGAMRADRDWDQHQVRFNVREIPSVEPQPGISVEICVDDASGLLLGDDILPDFVSVQIENGYRQEIAALIRRHGKPSWGAPPLPSPDELAKLLDSPDFIQVTKFPYRLTPKITLHNSSNGMVIQTGQSINGLGDSHGPPFVRRDPAFPTLIFLRAGNQTLGVLDENGNFLAFALRN